MTTSTVAPVANPLPPAADTTHQQQGFVIRPTFQQKFKQSQVQEIIHATLVERLSGSQYSPDTAPQIIKDLVDDVKRKLKEFNLPRYKYVVTGVLGEVKGEGVRADARCFWDQDADGFAKDTFINVC